MNFVYLFLNDYVLVYYHLAPCMRQNFRLSCSFTHWVVYINPHGFVTLSNFWGSLSFCIKSRSFHFRVCFSLFSLLFLSFFRLPNTPLKDDNSRDAWLSLIALKRRVASLVLGLLVDRTKTHVRIYNTNAQGLLSNSRQRRHKTC